MVKDVQFEEWDGWQDARFAPNHFFQTREWFSVLTSTCSELEIRIRMIDEQTALPVFRRRMGPLTFEGSPLRGYSTPYGGFLGPERREFRSEYFSGDLSEIALPPGSVIGDADGCSWQGRKTIVVDLRGGADAVWKGMKSETRNQIRKAVKSGVTVDVCTGTGWVDRAYEILTQTYTRQHVPVPVGIGFLRRIAETLSPGCARVFTARSGGTVAAYAIVCFDKHTAYYLDGGVDGAYRHLCPSHIIQWEALRWSAEEGREHYDMNGANMESIANFKAGFGGKLVQFMTREYTPTLAGAVAWKGYILLRPAIRRMRAMAHKG